jgi:hypothetical protein
MLTLGAKSLRKKGFCNFLKFLFTDAMVSIAFSFSLNILDILVSLFIVILI